MLLDGLSTPSSTEEAIDTAIASLLAARDRLDRTGVDHDTALRAVTAAKDGLWGDT
jgi:hypothetical protein